ncbi:hypothetical protein QR680_015428 [Steinernema hermaphroditum]|uniref:Uncharacterized protein n=1 Tax=Steinernema hermaphroditum TaxID=289476 RepID=A0AA39H9J8_9BILA|nr:hypothetical protein QR680_015428 [Steinernema hermaphroditum]
MKPKLFALHIQIDKVQKEVYYHFDDLSVLKLCHQTKMCCVEELDQMKDDSKVAISEMHIVDDKPRLEYPIERWIKVLDSRGRPLLDEFFRFVFGHLASEDLTLEITSPYVDDRLFSKLAKIAFSSVRTVYSNEGTWAFLKAQLDHGSMKTLELTGKWTPQQMAFLEGAGCECDVVFSG